jgi:hypothetical protein
MLAIGAEAADGLDLAHRANRRELRAGLPARAQNADRLRLFAGEIFDAEAVRRADADALHDAVRKDRERLAILDGEQEHETDITATRRRRHLDATHAAATLGPGHDIGIDADRADAEFRHHAVHRFEAVDRVACRRNQAIRAHPAHAAALAQFDIGVLQHIDAFAHRQELGHVVIGKNECHDRGRR